MAENFSRLYFLASPRDPNPPYARRREEYWQKIGLHGVNFLQDIYNSARPQAGFRELPEVGAIDDFYRWLQRIVTPLTSDDVVVLFRESVFWTVQQVQAGKLDRRLLIKSAPDYARADMRRITSETPQSLHDNWLAFGQ
jgi:hypothetical protein